jgi:immune inhibitor A
VDLRGMRAGSPATLKFSAWFDIEEQWDYAYVMASTDSGSTWVALKTGRSTDDNPNGNSYGHAYTGTSRSLAASGVWLADSADLSAYTGQEVLVRFEYITDDAVHGRGVCFDDFSIPEIGWQDDAETSGDWVAAGFARISNLIPQDYLVQVVRQPSSGQVSVSQMAVRPDGSGEVTISGLASDEKLTVIVSPVTAGVAGVARYLLKVSRGG